MKRLDNENSLYLIFNNVDAYIKENNEDKYLIFASTEKNKETLENYTEHWDENKNQTGTISGEKPIKYGREFMKIKFDTHDDLPLGEILNIPVCILALGFVFLENNNYYPQFYLHECLYEHDY